MLKIYYQDVAFENLPREVVELSDKGKLRDQKRRKYISSLEISAIW